MQPDAMWNPKVEKMQTALVEDILKDLNGMNEGRTKPDGTALTFKFVGVRPRLRTLRACPCIGRWSSGNANAFRCAALQLKLNPRRRLPLSPGSAPAEQWRRPRQRVLLLLGQLHGRYASPARIAPLPAVPGFPGSPSRCPLPRTSGQYSYRHATDHIQAFVTVYGVCV